MTTKTSAKLLSPSKCIKLTGTEQPDLIGQILTAGPMSVEFDNGNLRYLRFNGTEVLRAIGFWFVMKIGVPIRRRWKI